MGFVSFEPITRVAVSDEVFAQLTDEILSGRLQPGDPLPSERELAEAFGVNRHAIREALKRLQQSRLVLISQGGKTRVLDWRESAGLEVLIALVEAGSVPGSQVLRDVAQMRLTIGADAARLCALNADDVTRERVRAGAAGIGQDPDPASLVATDLTFWNAVIDGSGNLAYRLALNTLVAGFAAMGEANIVGLLAEYADGPAHRELATAICSGDAELSHRLAHALLSRVVDAMNPLESLVTES